MLCKEIECITPSVRLTLYVYYVYYVISFVMNLCRIYGRPRKCSILDSIHHKFEKGNVSLQFLTSIEWMIKSIITINTLIIALACCNRVNTHLIVLVTCASDANKNSPW